MSDRKTIQCKKCGKNITLENGMAKGFCLHCGEPFAVETVRVSTDDADRLYSEHKWRELLECVKNERHDPRLIAYRDVSRLFVLVADYEKNVNELAVNIRSDNPISFFFTGKNAFANDPLHSLFYADVDETTASLGRIFESPHVPEPLKTEASERIVAELLHPKGEEASAIYWSFVVCQQYAIPLIPHLSPDALLDAYVDFDYHNPKNQSLPNQIKVRNAFISAIKANGGQVPSHGQVRKMHKEQQQKTKQKP